MCRCRQARPEGSGPSISSPRDRGTTPEATGVPAARGVRWSEAGANLKGRMAMYPRGRGCGMWESP